MLLSILSLKIDEKYAISVAFTVIIFANLFLTLKIKISWVFVTDLSEQILLIALNSMHKKSILYLYNRLFTLFTIQKLTSC